jgi:hypothetical protein
MIYKNEMASQKINLTKGWDSQKIWYSFSTFGKVINELMASDGKTVRSLSFQFDHEFMTHI